MEFDYNLQIFNNMFKFNKKFEIWLFVVKSIRMFEKNYKSNTFKDWKSWYLQRGFRKVYGQGGIVGVWNGGGENWFKVWGIFISERKSEWNTKWEKNTHT